MAKPLFTFFLLFSFILSILSITIAYHPPKHSKPNQNFIKSSCRATRYSSLCYHSLKGYASKIGQSRRQLTLTALAVSLSRARSAARFASQMKRARGINRKELAAVKDCIDNMSDGVDQLNRSFQELATMGHTNGEDFMWHMSNVQTWVSAALTDASTCADGLSDRHYKSGNLKGAIQRRVNNVAQLTSNALAFVNRFV
ncbi:Pectinesterase inhibitor 9 [Bienertia sinuspersici]